MVWKSLTRLGGILALDGVTLTLYALILAAAGFGLFALSKATFRREEILTKWK